MKSFGTITFSSPSNGGVTIEIRDSKSRTRFLRIRMFHDELMRGLMGLAERQIEFEANHLDRVGKTATTAEVKVQMPKQYDYAAREAVAKELIDMEVDRLSRDTGKEWFASYRFGSRDGFTRDKDGAEFAHATATYYE